MASDVSGICIIAKKIGGFPDRIGKPKQQTKLEKFDRMCQRWHTN